MLSLHKRIKPREGGKKRWGEKAEFYSCPQLIRLYVEIIEFLGDWLPLGISSYLKSLALEVTQHWRRLQDALPLTLWGFCWRDPRWQFSWAGKCHGLPSPIFCNILKHLVSVWNYSKSSWQPSEIGAVNYPFYTYMKNPKFEKLTILPKGMLLKSGRAGTKPRSSRSWLITYFASKYSICLMMISDPVKFQNST